MSAEHDALRALAAALAPLVADLLRGGHVTPPTYRTGRGGELPAGVSARVFRETCQQIAAEGGPARKEGALWICEREAFHEYRTRKRADSKERSKALAAPSPTSQPTDEELVARALAASPYRPTRAA